LWDTNAFVVCFLCPCSQGRRAAASEAVARRPGARSTIRSRLAGCRSFGICCPVARNETGFGVRAA
jgi:hypothetical protein